MVRVRSHIDWFEDEEWIGSKISFDQPYSSTWILVENLSSREKYYGEWDWKHCHESSEARGIFVCEEEGQPHRQAVVKIYMQIPFIGTIREPRDVRAKQARMEMCESAKRELIALQELAGAGCSSTPSFIASKHESQNEKRYVPGGYITYILMEKAPGICLRYFWDLPRDERDQVRTAFKRAWEDCLNCGLINRDQGSRNVIWDKEQQKCYIVDWEDGSQPQANEIWTELLYFFWGLGQLGNDADFDDMSTWERL